MSNIKINVEEEVTSRYIICEQTHTGYIFPISGVFIYKDNAIKAYNERCENIKRSGKNTELDDIVLYEFKCERLLLLKGGTNIYGNNTIKSS